MSIYTSPYTGYIYLWYDTKSHFFYVGGHQGKVEDSYICSNQPMKRAYKIRPNTFKMRVLQYVDGNTDLLRQTEQKWLDLIKESELMTTENVQKGTCRYYNVKKTSCGGNGKGTNRGKSSIGGWNRGLRGAQKFTEETRLKLSMKKKEYWAKKKSESVIL